MISPSFSSSDRLGLLGPNSRTGDVPDLLSEDDYESQSLTKDFHLREQPVLIDSLTSYLPRRIRRLLYRRRIRVGSHRSCQRKCCPSPLARRFLFHTFLGGLLFLILFTALFRPSYTHSPPHYQALEARVLQSNVPGRANALNEKIFIAISLYDRAGHLVNGSWGQSVLDLVDLLGPNNVFLSIYENDSGQEGADALEVFKTKVKCRHEIISEINLSKDAFPKVTMPDGSQRLKRIMYLSEVRNRALRPLDKASDTVYDKVLFLNDIAFRPIDAAQLLFSTNVGRKGIADYLAACSVDFIDLFRFYDTFATRDSEGYSMGIPIYPWFSNAGSAQSRYDVLNQQDAVSVKSCWSGMVAVKAKYLQSSNQNLENGMQEIGSHTISPSHPKDISAPVRFRGEPELFFDACECCLFHADVQQVARRPILAHDTGVYLNPYVRVAYNQRVLWWLKIGRRFERLYSLPQQFLNIVVRMPAYNPYRAVNPIEKFDEEVWIPDANLPRNGSWQVVTRTARNGLYCGTRQMQVLLEQPRVKDRNWKKARIPNGGKLW